jgi:hypothetical protein
VFSKVEGEDRAVGFRVGFAARWLDLDNVRAEVREQPCAKRRSNSVAQLKDPDIAERTNPA